MLRRTRDAVKSYACQLQEEAGQGRAVEMRMDQCCRKYNCRKYIERVTIIE